MVVSFIYIVEKERDFNVNVMMVEESATPSEDEKNQKDFESIEFLMKEFLQSGSFGYCIGFDNK